MDDAHSKHDRGRACFSDIIALGIGGPTEYHRTLGRLPPILLASCIGSVRSRPVIAEASRSGFTAFMDCATRWMEARHGKAASPLSVQRTGGDPQGCKHPQDAGPRWPGATETDRSPWVGRAETRPIFTHCPPISSGETPEGRMEMLEDLSPNPLRGDSATPVARRRHPYRMRAGRPKWGGYKSSTFQEGNSGAGFHGLELIPRIARPESVSSSPIRRASANPCMHDPFQEGAPLGSP